MQQSGHQTRIKFFATGTWFQPFDKVDYPDTVFNRDTKYWDNEFKLLIDLEIDTFIFQFAAHNDTAYYNSSLFDKSEPILESVVDNIKEKNLSLTIGSYLSSEFYRSNDYQSILKNQYEMATKVFDEIFERYGSLPNINYWYIPQEIESTTFAQQYKKTALVNFMNKMIEYIKTKSDLPILIAPYFALDNLKHFEEWWDDFLTKVPTIDVIAMQDGMGCTRGIQLHHLDPYYAILKNICKSHKIKLWSTLEIFNYIDAPYLNNKPVKIQPAPFDRLKKQIEIENKYVEKIIFFEFAHFMSPQYSPESKELYQKYLNLIKSRDTA